MSTAPRYDRDEQLANVRARKAAVTGVPSLYLSQFEGISAWVDLRIIAVPAEDGR